MTLMSKKPYRWLKAMLGWRSFIKESKAGRASTYALIRGSEDGISTIASELKGMGYIEEWPKTERE